MLCYFCQNEKEDELEMFAGGGSYALYMCKDGVGCMGDELSNTELIEETDVPKCVK